MLSILPMLCIDRRLSVFRVGRIGRGPGAADKIGLVTVWQGCGWFKTIRQRAGGKGNAKHVESDFFLQSGICRGLMFNACPDVCARLRRRPERSTDCLQVMSPNSE